MSSVIDIYNALTAKCQSITTLSVVEDNISKISANHTSIDDYNSWIRVLAGRPEETMLQNALREYQMSLLANVIGLYNLSFSGLRFFFERTLTAILFSTKEIDLRLWLKGGRDTYWSEIIHQDTGLFSHTMCKAFFNELKDEVPHYKALMEKVYRECSEYVHGNNSAQSKIPNNLEFNNDLLNEWHDKADTMRGVILFAFCLRYLPYLSDEQIQIIEPSVTDQLSHIEIIRSYIQAKNN